MVLNGPQNAFSVYPRITVDEKTKSHSNDVMKTADKSWLNELVETLSKYVLKGNYKDGLVVAKKALKLYPKELVCQYQYAKLLGDWADELPPARRKKLKSEAARILRPLTRRLAGQPMERRFGLCVNYYYQSAAFKEMYAFGKRFEKTNRNKGLYAQALGAGLYAEALSLKAKPAKSTRPAKLAPAVKTWAAKSVKAWSKYPLKKEAYYFAHYSAAKSLALAGEDARALQKLKQAAKLSGRPLSDWEFQDVLKMIDRNSSTQTLTGE